jgi:hypothetical protein
MGSRPALALGVALLALGCAHPLPPVPADFAYPQPGARQHAASLRDSVEAIVAGGRNMGRLRAIRRRAAALGLGDSTRSEFIDWFSAQRNLLIEIPGRADRIVYVVAHYDKVDANPLTFASLLLNGLLDPLIGWSYLSEGAVDNATGVAVALELARALRARDSETTYRVLLTGSEESGLRGARAHVARLPADESAAIAFAVNIDSVGIKSSHNCVTLNASDPALARAAKRAAAQLEMPLPEGRMPRFASSDFAPFERTSFGTDLRRGIEFNLVGGLLPQRSWFTRARTASVVNFSSCEVTDGWDVVAGTILLPVGQIHGPRDRRSRVSVERLYEQFAIILQLLETKDREAPITTARE